MIVNKLADQSIDKSDSNFVLKQVKIKAKELYEQWSDLQVSLIHKKIKENLVLNIFLLFFLKQQAFKIPKKQRIEERKEHEREVNVVNDNNFDKKVIKGKNYYANLYLLK